MDLKAELFHKQEEFRLQKATNKDFIRMKNKDTVLFKNKFKTELLSCITI